MNLLSFSTLPCLLGAVALLGAAQSSAQADYPSRPIRLVVTSAAGGTGDTLARAVSRLAEKDLNANIQKDIGVLRNPIGHAGT